MYVCIISCYRKGIFQQVLKLNMTMNVASRVTNLFYTKCYKCLVYFSRPFTCTKT